MKKLVFLVLLVVMLVLPTAALADGATPYHFEGCYNETGPGYGYCYKDWGVRHENATPSGNYQYTFNGKQSVEFYFDGSVYGSYKFDYHRVYLAKDGSNQVSSARYSETYTYPNGTACTREYDYHWANGELRRSDYEYVCS